MTLNLFAIDGKDENENIEIENNEITLGKSNEIL